MLIVLLGRWLARLAYVARPDLRTEQCRHCLVTPKPCYRLRIAVTLLVVLMLSLSLMLLLSTAVCRLCCQRCSCSSLSSRFSLPLWYDCLSNIPPLACCRDCVHRDAFGRIACPCCQGLLSLQPRREYCWLTALSISMPLSVSSMGVVISSQRQVLWWCNRSVEVSQTVTSSCVRTVKAWLRRRITLNNDHTTLWKSFQVCEGLGVGQKNFINGSYGPHRPCRHR